MLFAYSYILKPKKTIRVLCFWDSIERDCEVLDLKKESMFHVQRVDDLQASERVMRQRDWRSSKRPLKHWPTGYTNDSLSPHRSGVMSSEALAWLAGPLNRLCSRLKLSKSLSHAMSQLLFTSGALKLASAGMNPDLCSRIRLKSVRPTKAEAPLLEVRRHKNLWSREQKRGALWSIECYAEAYT